VKIGTWKPGDPLCDSSYNFCDANTKNNLVYLYVVTVTVDASQSGPSNIVVKNR
jgi:hypothetical protein